MTTVTTSREAEIEQITRDLLALFDQPPCFGGGKWWTRSAWVDRDQIDAWKKALQ